MIDVIGSLPPGRYPATGDLPRHFLEGRPDLFPALYPRPARTPAELLEAARWRRTALAGGEDPAHRDVLATVLAEQNRRFGGGDTTARSVERLARPGTMAIVTGQQAGFLGGPLYTIFKALGAIRLARQLTADGVETVPIFWIAADDHDFQEIQPFTFITGGGLEIETLKLPGLDAEQGFPVGRRSPGVWSDVAERLGERYEGFSEPLEPYLAAYREAQDLGEAFGRVMTRLFARFGLILVDPTQQEIKSLTRPLLGRYLRRLDRVADALGSREADLAARGYSLQVPPLPGRTGLFRLDDEGRRRALLRQEADGRDLGRVLELAEQEPWRWSGSALTRCLFQDWLFPTAAYVAGPGEVAYLAQSMALYPALGMSAPAVVPRPSFTLIEAAAVRFLEKRGADPLAALLRPEELQPALLRETAGPELMESLERARHRLGLVLDDLEDALTTLDLNLRGPVGRVRGGGFKGLDTVEKKVRAALRRREKQTFDDLERTVNLISPRGKPQERALSGLSFVLRHGPGLLDGLLEAIEPCSGTHQLVACGSQKS